MLTLNFTRIATFIYISFAFDSLLKINFGIKIHLGILSILMLNAVVFLNSTNRIFHSASKGYLGKDYFFMAFMLYCFISGLLLEQPGFVSIFVYLIIAINVMIYCAYTAEILDRRAFYYFQIALIVTGLAQFFLFKFFNYQLTFIDAEHYQKGSSVSHRLRGFFVEPNWFSIAFVFNSLLLIGNNVERFYSSHKLLSILSIVVLILNGSLAPVAILLVIYSFPYIRKSPVKGVVLTIGLLLLLALVFSFRESINQKDAGTSLLNHNSRVVPYERVAEYQSEQSLPTILFGNGIGSWGTLAVGNRLSVLVYEEKSDARDGSEIPVFIFELGVVGFAILLLDLLYTFLKCSRKEFHLRGSILLFFVSFALYPTLKFWMYMPYYFYIRSLIYAKKHI